MLFFVEKIRFLLFWEGVIFCEGFVPNIEFYFKLKYMNNFHIFKRSKMLRKITFKILSICGVKIGWK